LRSLLGGLPLPWALVDDVCTSQCRCDDGSSSATSASRHYAEHHRRRVTLSSRVAMLGSLLSTKASRQSTLGYTHGSSLSADKRASYELDGDARHRQGFYPGSAAVWV